MHRVITFAVVCLLLTGVCASSALRAEDATRPTATEGAATDGVPADPDRGHMNPTPALAAPEEVRYDLAIYTFVVFALLMILLWKFAWGPIAKGLDARETAIAKMIEDAKSASETASKQLQQYELKLAQASEEAGRIIGEARRQADEVAAGIRSEAEAAAQRERDRAVADIETAKNQALREIAQKSVTTAVDLAGKIIRREVREADHQQLIAESLNRFSNSN